MATELTEAGREARAAYMREYRRRRKEQIKENFVRYWNKVGEQREAEKEKKRKEK